MARVKQVFETERVPHLWAHRTQESAKNAGGNLYFVGDTIYSYGSHFAIARHVVDNATKRKPKSAILFTTREYSVTTAKHLQMVRHAIPPNVPVFNVSDPATVGPHFEYEATAYLRQIELHVKAASETRIRETTRLERVEKAQKLIDECLAFCKFFGLKHPKFPKLPKIDQTKLETTRRSLADRRAKIDAKREVERKAYAEAHAREVAEWEASGICTHTPKHDLYSKYQCEFQRKDDEWAEKSAEIIQAWRDGNAPTSQLCNAYSLPVMLRVLQDAQTHMHSVETSQGVTVPVYGPTGAARLLRFVQALYEAKREYQCNGHTEHIGQFAVDSFKPAVLTASPDDASVPEWILTAGCHRIAYSEIERVADAINLADSKDNTRQNRTDDHGDVIAEPHTPQRS